jgi:hypothetical protein
MELLLQQHLSILYTSNKDIEMYAQKILMIEMYNPKSLEPACAEEVELGKR